MEVAMEFAPSLLAMQYFPLMTSHLVFNPDSTLFKSLLS